MKITKVFVKRIFGKMKQNKHISYRFHLNAQAGFGHDKEAVNYNLMNDLIKWGNEYGVKIDVEGDYNHVFGFTFIVRDYRTVELLANACKGKIIVDGQEIWA